MANQQKELLEQLFIGGQFSVFENDKYPFLREEANWISSCMEANLPILGLCQGAQQIAQLLGAKVGPTEDNRHEFGSVSYTHLTLPTIYSV